LFTLLYFFKPKYKKEHQSKVDKAFEKFIKKLNKNGLNILRIDSLDSIRGKIRISGVEKNSRLEKLLEIVDLYEMIKYAGLDSKEKQKEFLTQLKNRNIYQ
jgi:hypothetical protein